MDLIGYNKRVQKDKVTGFEKFAYRYPKYLMELRIFVPDLSWIVQDQNTEEPESGCYECQDHMQSQLFY